MSKKTTTKTDSKKKKKITFPKVMLILAIVVTVGILGYVIYDKIDSSVVKAVSIEGAYSELYVGNPMYNSVSYDVSVYPANANQGFTASSSDVSVATVSITADGKIKIDAVREGEATITIRSVAKSSIKDSCKVVVKSVDIQNVTFTQSSTSDPNEIKIIDSVEIQKDGLEHAIDFELDPIDANMDRLKVSSFDSSLENVWIDKENRRLVIVPKTDIENKTIPVYVEIYQNTTKGSVVSKRVRIMVNLVEREAYLNFEFAHDASSGLSFSGNHNNYVYLDPQGDSKIADFYTKVNIAYNKEFTNIGEFNVADFRVEINENVVFDYDSADVSADYIEDDKVVFTITKENNGEYFKIVAKEGFVSDESTCYKLSFIHRYTSVEGVVEIKYFKQNVLSEEGGAVTSWKIEYDDSTNSTDAIRYVGESDNRYAVTNGSTLILKSNIDKGIESGILGIYTTDTNGLKCSLFTDNKGNEIEITKNKNRLVLSARSTASFTQGASYILVRFKFYATYWDSRYLSSYNSLIASAYWQEIQFTVDDLFETNGDEIQRLSSTSSEAKVYFSNTFGDVGSSTQSQAVSIKDVKNSSGQSLKLQVGGNDYFVFKNNDNYYKAIITRDIDGKSFSVKYALLSTTTSGSDEDIVVTGVILDDATTVSPEEVVELTNGKFQVEFGFYNLTKTIYFTIG